MKRPYKGIRKPNMPVRLWDFLEGRLKNVFLIIVERTKKVASWANDNSSLIVAAATVALVLVTWWHIEEARKMRKETKRLADLQVEQFKITSYPTLMFTDVGGPNIKANKIFNDVRIYNKKGSVTAFRCTAMLVLAFINPKSGKTFQLEADSVYWVNEEHRSTLDFEEKIVQDSHLHIQAKTPIDDDHSIENLIDLLIFVRFKVPYDKAFSYETAAYVNECTSPEASESPSYLWQKLNTEDRKQLVIAYLEDLKNPQTAVKEAEKAKAFLADYHFNRW